MVAHCFAKYALFSLNIVGLVAGLVATGIGSWIIAGEPDFISGGSSITKGFGIALTVAGVIIAITSFFGCCGAGSNNRWLLIMYVLIVVIFFGAALSVGIIGIVREDLVQGALRLAIKSEIKKPNDYEGILVYAHGKFNCCGIDDMPNGCDIDYPPVSNCTAGSLQCQYGCMQPIWDAYIAPSVKATVAILIATSAILISFCSCACCICLAVGGHDRNHACYNAIF